MPSPSRNWYGRQSYDCTHFRYRELTSINSRRSRYVLADVGCVWNPYVRCRARFIASNADCALRNRGVSFNLAAWTTSRQLVWRLQIGSAAIPAIPLLFGVYLCPGKSCLHSWVPVNNIKLESPRWYIKKNQYLNAFASLRRLRKTDIQAARDLYYIHEQLNGTFISNEEDELTSRKKNGYATRFLQLFTEKKRIRPATIAAFIVMISQQMCGSKLLPFQCNKALMLIPVQSML